MSVHSRGMSGHGRPAPLVAPSPEISADRLERAQRQLLLPGFGEEAQRRLYAARVLVIGAGGLGSACVPYLVGAGVGTIGVIDDDVVELSNLHRQIAHGTADIGRSKTASLADTAARLDEGVHIVQHQLRLDSSNALELFRGYDLVIDGSDNFPTRYLANDAAQLSGVPLVWGSILQFHGQVSVAWHSHGPGFRDLFPSPPPPDTVVSCGTGGVLPGLCGTVGSLLATEAMKLITGIGDPLIGRVLLYDALAARTRELPFSRDPEASPITGLIDYEGFCMGTAEQPPSLSVDEWLAMRDAGEPVRLIDVRTPQERAAKHIQGSEALPLDELEAGTARIDNDGSAIPVVVYCAQGPRSVRAAQLLAAQGVRSSYLAGGVRALTASLSNHPGDHAARTVWAGTDLEDTRV